MASSALSSAVCSKSSIAEPYRAWSE